MGRWKPAPPRSSPYITPAGFARLQLEEKALWQRRAIVTKAVTAAAAEGDRSENAEYIYRKKELRGIDARIRYLQKRLPNLKVVSTAPSDPQRVFFGAYVLLVDEEGQECRYRIVGADELDPQQGHISIDSPVARALLNTAVDDEVAVETPTGVAKYWVVEVRYEQ